MINKPKILISDDDETLCYLLKEELVNEDYSVDIVYDGKYAIEKLKEKVLFVYYDLPDGLKRFKRKEKGLYLYYLFWQWGAVLLVFSSRSGSSSSSCFTGGGISS